MADMMQMLRKNKKTESVADQSSLFSSAASGCESEQLSVSDDGSYGGKYAQSDFTSVQRSNLTFDARRFMFDEDRIAAREAFDQTNQHHRDVSNLKVRFDAVANYVEIDLLDAEGRISEQDINIYVKTAYPIRAIFEDFPSMPLDQVSSKKAATQFWKKVPMWQDYSDDLSDDLESAVPLEDDEDGTIYTEEDDVSAEKKSGISNLELSMTKEQLDTDMSIKNMNVKGRFSKLVKVIEHNWKEGGSADAEEFGSALFPHGDREFVEEENYHYMRQILDLIPKPGDKGSVNEDKFCEIFAHYSALVLVTAGITEGFFRHNANLFFGHRYISTDNVRFDSNWDDIGREGVERLLKLFEQEVDTIKLVEDYSFREVGTLSQKVVERLERKIIMCLEESPEEQFIHSPNGRFQSESDPEGQVYRDMIKGTEMNVLSRELPENDGEIHTAYYDLDADGMMNDPYPVVVPQSWNHIDLRMFLLRPHFAWNQAKLIFLKAYFDFMNQGMISACLNDNVRMLKLFRDHPIPHTFKTPKIACLSYAENARMGTMQLPILRKSNMGANGETPGNKKRYLVANSSTFYLNPLVRADLMFSYQQHCMAAQKCTGHSGFLLLFMIRQQKTEIVKMLVENGVRVNSKCCFGDARKFSWEAELEEAPTGEFVEAECLLPKTERNGQVEGSKNDGMKLYRRLRGSDTNHPQESLSSKLEDYIHETGLMDDERIRELAKLSKITPLAAAVECAIETGDNSVVEYLIKHGATTWRADAVGFRACTGVLRKIASVAKVGNTENISSRKESKLTSLQSNKTFNLINIFKFGRNRKGFMGKKKFDGNVLSSSILGSCLTKRTRTMLKKSSDLILCQNLKCLEIIVSQAKKDIRAKIAKGKVMKSEDSSNFDIEVLLRTTWLHHAVMHEEWDIVRFLCNRFSSAPQKDTRAAQLSDEAVRSTVDLLLFSLSKGGVPFTSQAINGLVFLMEEIDYLLSYVQFDSLIKILSAALNVPFQRAGVAKAMLRLAKTAQFQHYHGVKNIPEVLERLSEDEKDMLDVSIVEENRRDMALLFLSVGLPKVAEVLVYDKFLESIDWLDDALSMVTMNNYATDSLPYVFSLISQVEYEFKDKVNEALYAALSYRGLALEIIRVGNCLTEHNAATFLNRLLTANDSLPLISPMEVVGDYSRFMTLIYVVQFLKSKNLTKFQDAIYQKLFKKLGRAKNYWVDGLGYVFDHADIKTNSEVRETFEFYVYENVEMTFSFDVSKQALSIRNLEKLNTSRMQDEDDNNSQNTTKSFGFSRLRKRQKGTKDISEMV